ncbi:MAG: tetratricopeptide repeat protein [Gemmataceae bacterium]|nr:tetratricopeptide repeat protein [Gemmataceae bacterium]
MRYRRYWWFCALCLGCQAVENTSSSPATGRLLVEQSSNLTAQSAQPENSSYVSKRIPLQAAKADEHWLQGQKAMQDGEYDQAIAFYQKALAAERGASKSFLSLAAAYLAQGDEDSACVALGQFVDANPEHRNGRYFLAELLAKTGRRRDARREFEQVVADNQQENPKDIRHLSHCHSRLMDLAEADADEYHFFLHRGIGLYWLSVGRFEAGDPTGDLPAEGLLCKAAAELSEAHELRPQEARPCWYLHAVWRQLAQAQPASRWLRQAHDAAPFTYLTPAERGSLHLACSPLGPGRSSR